VSPQLPPSQPCSGERERLPRATLGLRVIVSAVVVAAAQACSAASAPARALPAKGHATPFDPVDRLLDKAVVERAFPGGVLVVGRAAGVVHTHTFGRLTYASDSPRVTEATLYDLASVTKVVATTAMAMVLLDQGRLDLDATVGRYLGTAECGSEAGSRPLCAVRVRDLLAHSSGVPAWAPLYRELRGQEAHVAHILAMEPDCAPGTKSVYSDLGMIVLGAILERVAGEPLDVAARRLCFEPLGMDDTDYRPARSLLDHVAPTEQDGWRARMLRGEVDDENAYAMGGVAGHAGLFGTGRDLARFAQMMLRRGEVGGRRLLSEATVHLFTANCGVPGSNRALGWEMPGGDPFIGALWSPRSFGHTGVTGTFLWIDPENDVFIVLLTNRVYPTRANEAFREVRRQASDLVLSIERPAPGRRR
jgi:CubicO group peptidase (beta-lactamase class C family)